MKFKIKVIACSNPQWWYADKIGKKFTVTNSEEAGDYELDDSTSLLKRDCEVLPNQFNKAIIRPTRNGGFRTTLVGKNGEVMFTSEVYTTKGKAKQTLKLFPDFEVVDKTR